MDVNWQRKVPEQETSAVRKSKYHSQSLYLIYKDFSGLSRRLSFLIFAYAWLLKQSYYELSLNCMENTLMKADYVSKYVEVYLKSRDL